MTLDSAKLKIEEKIQAWYLNIIDLQLPTKSFYLLLNNGTFNVSTLTDVLF